MKPQFFDSEPGLSAGTHSPVEAPRPTARHWLKILSTYRKPQIGRSVFELLITVIPFITVWGLAMIALHYGIWWGLILILPAAGLLLRLFAIQHDCGHGAFFANRPADNWTGRILGILTFTPYDYWRHTHSVHHATAGNLDKRGLGDIITLTVDEYRALTSWGRFRYRLYRNPIVLFLLGPAWIYLVQQRLPIGMMRDGFKPWLSTMTNTLAIVVMMTLLIWWLGIASVLLVQIPVVMLAGAAGIWLFYVQHQFEDTHWSNGAEWDFQTAALRGSSHYDLPGVLRWLTANIGIHHVHHLASKIPYYRLPEVLRDHPDLVPQSRITIMDSIRTVKLVLWCEARGRLVSFREAAPGWLAPGE